MTRAILMAASAGLALSACGSSEQPLNQTGPNPQIPAIQQRLVPAMKIARPTGWGNERPAVPAGFRIDPIATDLKVPRQLLVLPNGDVLVAEGKGGNAPALRPKDVIASYIKSLGVTSVKGGDRVTLLRDADGDGRYETRSVFIEGLNAPYGLAFVDGGVYVANQDALLRFPYSGGETRITTPGQLVTKLPAEINHHWTKSLTASADGTKLYVGIGSNSNVGERGMAVEEERAVVWEIDRATGARRTLVSGIRNPTALAVDPWRGQVWAVVNERDEIGPQASPDYLTSLRPGAFYGWPYSYWGKVDPRIRPARPDLVRTAVVPDYALGSHVAALGLTFMPAGGLPGLGNGAFVGEHGSWNRNNISGYKVAFIPFAGGRPWGRPQDFVTGFLKDGKARGRPVGVLFDPRGQALLVADDLSNTVWRVTRIAPAPAPAVTGAQPPRT